MKTELYAVNATGPMTAAVQLSMILELRQALAESQKDEIADLLKTIEENIEGITGPFCVDLKAISELGRIEDEMIRVNDVIKARRWSTFPKRFYRPGGSQ